MREWLAVFSILAGPLLMPDSVLIVDGEEICVKPHVPCAEVVDAVRSGRWRLTGNGTPTDVRCHPRPGCFSDRSMCILGYNCR